MTFAVSNARTDPFVFACLCFVLGQDTCWQRRWFKKVAFTFALSSTNLEREIAIHGLWTSCRRNQIGRACMQQEATSSKHFAPLLLKEY